MLRAKTKKEVFNALDSTRFSSANFDISFGDGHAEDLVEILFIPNNQFQFTINAVGADGERFTTHESPGIKFLSTQNFIRSSLDDCLSAITRWADRVMEEYTHQNPIYGDFVEFKEAIDKKLAEHIQDESMHFTRVEADELAEKLDLLAQRVNELEAKLGSSVNPNASEILVKDIETLKADANVLPKGAWYRKAGAKVLGFIKAVATSDEAKQLALEAARQALLPGPKG